MLKYIMTLAPFLLAQEASAMKLTSKDFTHEGNIPQLFTCEGKDLSPELSWSDVPEGTKSFVMIMDDPDAPMGTYDHWVLFNIPGQTRSFVQGMKEYPVGSVKGQNSWKRNDYGGPCPPTGVHRYFFKLYALDSNLGLVEGATKHEVEQAMQGHILGQTELMGKYQKVGQKP